MGVRLSCLGTQENLPKPVLSSSNKLDFFKLDCFHSSSPAKRSNRDDDDEEEEQRMKMKRSLGEWLAEPSPTSGRSTFGSSMESFIFMSFSKKVHPSSSSVNNPRESFSAKEKLLNDESQSQKEKKKLKKKKVSFKLPEDNDIIIFPPSPQSNQEEDKDMMVL